MDFDTCSTDRRRILDLRGRGFPDVPVVGHYRYTSSMPPLAPQSNDRFLEVCLMVKGEQRYQLGREDVVLRGKHVLLIPPGETFSTGGEPETNGELYWFFFRLSGDPDDAPAEHSFLGFTPGETRRIREIVDAAGSRIHPASDRLVALAERPFAAAGIEEADLGSAALRVALMDLVLELCAIARGAGAAPQVSPEIARVTQYLQQSPGGRTDLARLAAVANLSVSRFKERFRAEVGFTPKVYANHVRIRLAKEALARDDTDLTRLAADLGFSSSQYFSHVFRKFAGVSPSEYRRRHRAP